MNIALILSGGRGLRLGADIPKQYIEAGGRTIISYCIETIAKSSYIDAVQIVADDMWHDRIRKDIDYYDDSHKFRGFTEPGQTRQLSIFNGLESIRKYADDSDVVFIHDAARPCLSGELIESCVSRLTGGNNNEAAEYDGVLPVLPMKDTIYMSNDGMHVDSLLDRSTLFAGQAPELFRLGRYYEANKALLPDRIYSINGSTEPAVIAGMNIAVIPGDENNYKITTNADLERFITAINAGKNGD